MKKNLILLVILLFIITSCSNKEIVNDANVIEVDIFTAISTLNQKYSARSVGKGVPENHKIDWASVAIADGGGAALGAQIASGSVNPYVIAASAIGVGVYASVAEYDRQKADTTTNNVAMAIDRNEPICSGWGNLVPELDNSELGNEVGLYHNIITEALVLEEYDFYEHDIEAILLYIVSMYMNYADENFDINEIVNSIVVNGIDNSSGLDSETIDIIEEYNNVALSLDDDNRFSYTYEFIEILNNYGRYDDVIIQCAIATTYYSSYLWNDYIVDEFENE